jgi:hypothetical protein
MAYQLITGKHKGQALEPLPFLDIRHVVWMKSVFGEEDARVRHLNSLFMIAERKPVLVPCGGESFSGRPCVRPPSMLRIPIVRGVLDAMSASIVCDAREHEDYLKTAMGQDFLSFELSFSGLEKFLATRPSRHQVNAFARKLAVAWGIVGGKTRLTRGKILKFFEEAPAGKP